MSCRCRDDPPERHCGSCPPRDACARLLSLEGPANLSDEFRGRKPSTHRMDTMALHVRGPLRRPDLPGLFARVCAQMASEKPRVVVCEVSGCKPDLVALAALARLQLAAR